MTEGFTRTEVALLEALERERALLRQRDLINGMVLHEMANAVLIVSGTTEMLRTSDPGSALHQFAIVQLKGGVRSLNEMICGLRILIEGVGDQPVFASGDLVAFVRSVVLDPLLVAGTAPDRVAFGAQRTDPPLVFCATLLRHALGNLVRNALKYSPASSVVSVTIRGRGANRWIHVLNRGSKIRTNVASRLFEPGKKSAQGGMGLGLHITRACALRMGGRLVFGTTNAATVFSLMLPHRGAAPESVPPAPKATGVRPTDAPAPGNTHRLVSVAQADSPAESAPWVAEKRLPAISESETCSCSRPSTAGCLGAAAPEGPPPCA